MLTKEQFSAKKISTDPQKLELPDGDFVMVLPVGSKIMREYRSCLRDEDGKPLESHKPFVDELLIARILVDESGQRMYSDDEVLAGDLTNLDPGTWDTLMSFAWGYLTGGDRQKKSSTTDSGDPS